MLDESRNEQPQWKDPIHITKEQWMSMLEDSDLITEKDITLLKLIFHSKNSEARSSQLAQLLKMPHYLPINSQIGWTIGKEDSRKARYSGSDAIPPDE
jgi:5-methylcytosine-specific restriction enzyme A